MASVAMLDGNDRSVIVSALYLLLAVRDTQDDDTLPPRGEIEDVLRRVRDSTVVTGPIEPRAAPPHPGYPRRGEPRVMHGGRDVTQLGPVDRVLAPDDDVVDDRRGNFRLP